MMQDQYVGDIGDYAKYALLRALSHGKDWQLGVARYLYPHEEGTAGNLIQYLDDPDAWQGVDPPLFASLQDIIDRWRARAGEQSVTEIMARGPLLQAEFAHELLCSHPRTNDEPDRLQWRHGWFERVIERLRDCNIVFADPDNGLCEDGNFHYDGREGAWKRIPLCEALQLAGVRPTVIYHHYTRFPRGAQGQDGPQAEIEHWMQRIPNCTHAFRCRRGGTNRIFFVLNGEPIVGNLMAFVGRWRDAEARAGINDDGLSYLFPWDGTP